MNFKITIHSIASFALILIYLHSGKKMSDYMMKGISWKHLHPNMSLRLTGSKNQKQTSIKIQFQFFKHTPNKPHLIHISHPPTNNLQPFLHTPYPYRNKTITKLNLRTDCPVFNNPQINQHIFKSILHLFSLQNKVR